MKPSITELQTRADRVWVDGEMICIHLLDEREIRFPIARNRRLRKGTPEQVRHVELICNGTGLHWPDLDEDLSVAGILDGRVGSAE